MKLLDLEIERTLRSLGIQLTRAEAAELRDGLEDLLERRTEIMFTSRVLTMNLS